MKIIEESRRAKVFNLRLSLEFWSRLSLFGTGAAPPQRTVYAGQRCERGRALRAAAA